MRVAVLRIGRTLADTVVHLVHVQVLDIRGEHPVEQLQGRVTTCAWVRTAERRTMFKTSFPGSSHHILAGYLVCNSRGVCCRFVSVENVAQQV